MRILVETANDRKVFAWYTREIRTNWHEAIPGKFDLANGEYTSSGPEMKPLGERRSHIELGQSTVCAEKPTDLGLLRRRG